MPVVRSYSVCLLVCALTATILAVHSKAPPIWFAAGFVLGCSWMVIVFDTMMARKSKDGG